MPAVHLSTRLSVLAVLLVALLLLTLLVTLLLVALVPAAGLLLAALPVPLAALLGVPAAALLGPLLVTAVLLGLELPAVLPRALAVGRSLSTTSLSLVVVPVHRTKMVVRNPG